MSAKLTAYFSASGVTAEKAKAFSQAASTQLYEIKPVKPYTDSELNWRNPLSRCNREKITGTKPEIIKGDIDISEFDVIFVGFPIWYYCEPLVIDSFLDAYDFKGKTVVLFATSGGSAFGKTVQKLIDKYPGVKFVEGPLLNGSYTAEQLKEIAEKY